MEESNDPQPATGRRDLVLLGVLILSSAILHGWMIVHTEVAARDSIAFIRYAWRLQHEPWPQVLRTSLHPPLYPLTVLAVSLPLRCCSQAAEPLLMQYAAQMASLLAGVLLVIPMYFLGRAIFDRRVGFWSALFFQCMPVAARALSDGLTEGVFLLLIATGLLAALYALRTGSRGLFALTGFCGGLAYLARPEGTLLLAAVVLILWRVRGIAARRKWLATGSLGGAALAVALPYICVIGGVTNKTTGTWLLEWLHSAAHAAEVHQLTPPLLLAEFAGTWNEANHAAQLRWGALALLKETGKGFHYVAWLPALLGLWWFRRRWRDEPGVRVIWLLCMMQAVLLLRVSVVAGYVSERHTLLFVLAAAPWALAAALDLPRRVGVVWQRPLLGAAFAFALVVSGLPSNLKALHSSRVGHRVAGFWLAEHAQPYDEISDPFCWAHYYAGRVFCEGREPSPPDGQSRTQYVVIDRANHHSRLPHLQEALHTIQWGTIVFSWPPSAEPEKASVQVYRVTYERSARK